MTDGLRAIGKFLFRIAAGVPGAKPLWARLVTRLSLAFALCALVYTVLKFPGGPETIPRYFVKIGWFWIVVVLMEVCGTCLDAVAIRALASPEQDKLAIRQTLLAQLSGRAVNVVTPTGNLGEVVKMSVLTEYVSQSRAVSTILLYNIIRFIIELGFVALAAPFCALLVPMSDGMRILIFAIGGVCFLISAGCFYLVRRGMLASVAGLAVKIRILSKARHARWSEKLAAVDDKLRLVSGARKRDRWIGVICITLSQMTSMALSLSILVVLGESLTLGFIGAYIVGGFVIYNIAVLVPMGLGLNEGGWYGLLTMMGEPPARIAAGQMMVYARRVTLILYAAVGLFLVMASSTVKRAKERQKAQQAQQRVSEPTPEGVPVTPPTPVPSSE